MMKTFTASGGAWRVRILFPGSRYGSGNRLAWTGRDGHDHGVEFWWEVTWPNASDFRDTDGFQFVSRYYASTLLNDFKPGHGRAGLNLNGGVPEWSIDWYDLRRVLDWVRQATPTVGMGVTRIVGSDRYPYTVVEVKTQKRIVVQADFYRLSNESPPGPTENQRYEYEQNPDAPRTTLTFRKGGYWAPLGDRRVYCPYFVGNRRAYQDPHF